MHPEYRFPELHSDIALIELGRRVEFKLDEFGDTPTCLDKGLDLPGKLVTVQVRKRFSPVLLCILKLVKGYGGLRKNERGYRLKPKHVMSWS